MKRIRRVLRRGWRVPWPMLSASVVLAASVTAAWQFGAWLDSRGSRESLLRGERGAPPVESRAPEDSRVGSSPRFGGRQPLGTETMGRPPSTAVPSTSPDETASEPDPDDIALLRARRLIIPVAGVGPDQLVSSFHDTRRGSARHEAMDVPAARGTPVLAVERGRIVKLFVSKPGGLTVYQFDPDERFAYYYAHLDRYAVGLAEGMVVERGSEIGYVGSSGNASPDAPHLHFAVFRLGPERRWWQGTPIDPFLLWR